MSRVRVWLKTFDSSGVLWDDFIEITDHVDMSSIGTLTQSLDNTEFDIGVVRNSNVTLKLFNGHGLFSTPDIAESLFRYQRNDSIVKITWNISDDDVQACFFNSCGTLIGEDKTIFEGILNDDATSDAAASQVVSFVVLGYESILSRLTVPFSSISNGDTLQSVIYACLNQSLLTQFITVSLSNINLDSNVTIDDKTTLENKTVYEALRILLLLSNSVLYINLSNAVIVTPRTEGATVAYTFYGPGADAGTENIVDLTDKRSGVQRVFNYVTWKDTSLAQSDTSSISLNGTRVKSIESSVITDTTKRNTILSNILDEFKNAKSELTIKTVVNNCTILDVFLLDKVSIDFPRIPVESNEGELPRYDSAIYDDAFYPNGLFNLNIEALDSWKIVDRKFDVKSETLQFRLRAV